MAVHNRSSTGFSKALVHRGSFVKWRFWMFEVYHWQAAGRWQKQAFSDVKGTREERLCQRIYFQSHGFNRGKYGSQDNLEHITPSKEACTFASITMINISNKKKCVTIKLCHMKGAKREIWSTFWICISDWNRLGASFFFTDILNLSAPFAQVLRYTIGMLIYETSALVPRNNIITKHAHTAVTEWAAKQCMLLGGWRENDLQWPFRKLFEKHQSMKSPKVTSKFYQTDLSDTKNIVIKSISDLSTWINN